MGEYFARSSARMGMVPVVTRSTTLVAMPLPMPGIARRAFGSWTRVSSWVVCCWMASAARW